ncbi:benzoate transporter [Chromatiales bacterium (ex Bugula neritina AB1)]|nr:benzoate transporter [Chromatiales bacterium (ex Bugula neritina AB1)]
MFGDISVRAIFMGLLAAFVGYASSFAIVLSGLTAVGASTQQATTGLFFATVGMGICGVWLALQTRTPAAVAWSTPGAAFLASSVLLPGGFAEATGAFIVSALLIVITGFIPVLSRLVSAIPRPVASALLAGVLLNLCFAPALSLGSVPLYVLPILAAWLLGLLWHKLAAMPFAVFAFVMVLAFAVDSPAAATGLSYRWPELTVLYPVFSFQAIVSVSIPLYLVTMAGQNIPGFTLLELNRYSVDRPQLLKTTGFFSLLIAPFGSIPVNMSAITAAMMCGEDAGRNVSRRYWAAATCGTVYTVVAFGSAVLIELANLAPAGLITAVAGLALIPALVASLSAAFSSPQQLEAPALTFLITASGMSLMGVSGAFWGIVAGVLVWQLKQVRE